jgi:hypothetical protein
MGPIKMQAREMRRRYIARYEAMANEIEQNV